MILLRAPPPPQLCNIPLTFATHACLQTKFGGAASTTTARDDTIMLRLISQTYIEGKGSKKQLGKKAPESTERGPSPHCCVVPFSTNDFLCFLTFTGVERACKTKWPGLFFQQQKHLFNLHVLM